MLAAQSGTELRLAFRNGEQVLLTLLIPIVLLVGLSVLDVVPLPEPRIAAVTPAVLALAVLSTAFTGQAIALGFDRRYGVIRRLAATALPRWLLVAGRFAAVSGWWRSRSWCSAALAAGLGWRPAPAGLGWARAAGAARLRRVRGARHPARRHAARRDHAGGGQRGVVRAAAGRRHRRAAGPAARPAGHGRRRCCRPGRWPRACARALTTGSRPPAGQVLVLLAWAAVAGAVAVRTVKLR